MQSENENPMQLVTQMMQQVATFTSDLKVRAATFERLETVLTKVINLSPSPTWNPMIPALFQDREGQTLLAVLTDYRTGASAITDYVDLCIEKLKVIKTNSGGSL